MTDHRGPVQTIHTTVTLDTAVVVTTYDDGSSEMDVRPRRDEEWLGWYGRFPGARAGDRISVGPRGAFIKRCAP